MELNKIYNIDFLKNTLPDKCASVIIADPPYFEVKGEFDFIWGSFDDYLKNVEVWTKECKRILSDNGTLFWYGDSKKIAYSQIIIDKYFDLISNVTIHIYDRQTNKIKADDALGFINTSERLMMYANEKKNNIIKIEGIREYIRGEIIKSKKEINFKEINKALGAATSGGGLASSCLSLNKSEPNIITEEMYIKLQEWCYPFMDKKYSEIINEYNEKSRIFKPYDAYKMDVLRISQESHITSKYRHDTVKPEKLSRILISSCSRSGDLIVVPFAGSGTECAMAAKEKRNFIGFEIEKKYVEMATKRVIKIIKEPELF